MTAVEMPVVTMPGPADDPLQTMVAWLSIDPADPPLGVLATVGPDGAPHGRPVSCTGSSRGRRSAG